LVGGQIGYNWQINWAVIGFETDAAWTDIKGKARPTVVSGLDAPSSSSRIV
jgi:hypothetical protein